MKNNNALALFIAGIALFLTSQNLIQSIDADPLWKKIAYAIALALVLFLTVRILLGMRRKKE